MESLLSLARMYWDREPVWAFESGGKPRTPNASAKFGCPRRADVMVHRKTPHVVSYNKSKNPTKFPTKGTIKVTTKAHANGNHFGLPRREASFSLAFSSSSGGGAAGAVLGAGAAGGVG